MIWLYVIAAWLVGSSVLGLAVAQLTWAAMDRREEKRGH